MDPDNIDALDTADKGPGPITTSRPGVPSQESATQESATRESATQESATQEISFWKIPQAPFGQNRNKWKYIGLLILLFLAVVSFGADMFAPYDPWARFVPFSPPSGAHLLGTNDMGNDIFSELLFAGRVSLITGFGAACIATGIGLLLGIFAGYKRGKSEEAVMGFTDVVMLIPRIPVIIIFAAFYRPSFVVITLVLGLLWWPSTARVVRSKTLQVRESGFVVMDRSIGFSSFYIMITDILPNIVLVVLPKFMLTAASAMISEASLSFLGLGDPNVKSWGVMISYAFLKGGFVNEMWWWYIPPGLGIMGAVGALIGLELLLKRDQAAPLAEF